MLAYGAQTLDDCFEEFLVEVMIVFCFYLLRDSSNSKRLFQTRDLDLTLQQFLYLTKTSFPSFLPSPLHIESKAKKKEQWHCAKSVQIGSYFWSVFFCIRIEYRKIRTRNNSVFGYFSRSEDLYNHYIFLLTKILMQSRVRHLCQYDGRFLEKQVVTRNSKFFYKKLHHRCF